MVEGVGCHVVDTRYPPSNSRLSCRLRNHPARRSCRVLIVILRTKESDSIDFPHIFEEMSVAMSEEMGAGRLRFPRPRDNGRGDLGDPGRRADHGAAVDGIEVGLLETRGIPLSHAGLKRTIDRQARSDSRVLNEYLSDMTVQTFRDLLSQQPFRPFHLVMSRDCRIRTISRLWRADSFFDPEGVKPISPGQRPGLPKVPKHLRPERAGQPRAPRGWRAKP